MDDNCGEWEESIWVWLVCGMYWCGYQEVGVVRMYIYIYIYNYIYSCGIYMGVARRWVWLVCGY